MHLKTLTCPKVETATLVEAGTGWSFTDRFSIIVRDVKRCGREERRKSNQSLH